MSLGSKSQTPLIFCAKGPTELQRDPSHCRLITLQTHHIIQAEAIPDAQTPEQVRAIERIVSRGRH